jgi:hypothetical protein
VNQPGVIAVPGDFNGDGKTDIAFYKPDGGWNTVPVLFSNGDGTWRATNLPAPDWANQPGVIAVPGDFNGDGKTDIAFYRPGGGWNMVPVDLTDICLVAHSYGGWIDSGDLEQIGNRVSSIVWLDAFKLAMVRGRSILPTRASVRPFWMPRKGQGGLSAAREARAHLGQRERQRLCKLEADRASHRHIFVAIELSGTGGQGSEKTCIRAIKFSSPVSDRVLEECKAYKSWRTFERASGQSRVAIAGASLMKRRTAQPRKGTENSQRGYRPEEPVTRGPQSRRRPARPSSSRREHPTVNYLTPLYRSLNYLFYERGPDGETSATYWLGVWFREDFEHPGNLGR